jgi:hypothetical protein
MRRWFVHTIGQTDCDAPASPHDPSARAEASGARPFCHAGIDVILSSRSDEVAPHLAVHSFRFAIALGLLLVTGEARAVDPFEIQVYDATANPPGVPGLELHVNTVPIGLAASPSPPEYPEDHQSHFTLEPSLGVFPWWELGAYFETALRGDQAFDYAGVKLRSKFVTPPGWNSHWRLGLNVEFSLLPEGYDRSRWGNELRPIVAWESERFEFALNPIVDTSLADPDWRAGPSFEPCLMAVYKVQNAVSFGIEYYANLGPFSSGFLSTREEEHYLFEVFNLLSVQRFELNAGVGEGLTTGSNGLILKAILGYVWEKNPEPAPVSSLRSLMTSR